MSARSGVANACVETAADGLVVAVCNTTDRTGPTLVVPSAKWQAFLDLRSGQVDYTVLGVPAPFGPFEISLAPDKLVHVALRDDPTGPTIRYTRREWDVFTAGVTIDGEFTIDWLLDAPVPA